MPLSHLNFATFSAASSMAGAGKNAWMPSLLLLLISILFLAWTSALIFLTTYWDISPLCSLQPALLHASLQKLSDLPNSKKNQGKELQDEICHSLLPFTVYLCFPQETVLPAVAATLWGTRKSKKSFPDRIPLVLPHTLQHLALGNWLLCLCSVSPFPPQSDPRHGTHSRHHSHSLFTKVVLPLFISNPYTLLLW